MLVSWSSILNTNANATPYINEPGTTVGISKNKLIVKKIKKVLFTMPKTQCERVIIAAGRVSISSDFIAMCADEGMQFCMDAFTIMHLKLD